MEVSPEILTQLQKSLPLEQVYYARFSFLGRERQHLLLIVHHKPGRSAKALRPVAELVLGVESRLTFEILFSADHKARVKQGSLFYSFMSLPSHRVYIGAKSEGWKPRPEHFVGAASSARETLQQLEQEASGFAYVAKSYAGQQNYGRAAGMLYQSLHYSIRLLQTCVHGKANKVPDLINRLRSLSEQLPMLREEFLKNDGIDIRRMGLLNKAHAAMTNHRDMDVTEDDYNYLSIRWEALRNGIDEFYTLLLRSLTIELAEQQLGGRSLSVKHAWPRVFKLDAEALLGHIQKIHNPEQVFLLREDVGEQIRLYLIVIMKNRGPIRYREYAQGRARGLAIFYEPSPFRRGLADRKSIDHRFFVSVVKNGVSLYRKPSFEDRWEVPAPSQGAPDTVRRFYDVSRRQLHYLRDFHDATDRNDHHMRSYLLGQLLEKGLCAYLKVSLGFDAGDLPLKHLVDFSVLGGPSIKEFLTRQLISDGELTETIYEYRHHWRHCTGSDELVSIAAAPMDFARRWVEHVDHLCARALGLPV